MKRLTLTAIVALWAGSTVLADIPLPKDLQYVTPRVRFVGVEKYKDYVFYVTLKTFVSGPANAPTVRFEVKNAEPFALSGTQRRINNMFLLALKSEEFNKLKGSEKDLNWLTEKTPGVLSAPLSTPATVVSAKLKQAPVTEYNVSITDGKLKADMQPKEKRQSELTPEDGRARPWVIGIACALSLSFLGVWFARRRLAN